MEDRRCDRTSGAADNSDVVEDLDKRLIHLEPRRVWARIPHPSSGVRQPYYSSKVSICQKQHHFVKTVLELQLVHLHRSTTEHIDKPIYPWVCRFPFVP